MDSALLGLVGVSAAVMTAAVLYQQATKPKYPKPNKAKSSKSHNPSNSANKGGASNSANKGSASNSARKPNSIPVKSNFKDAKEGVLGSNPNPAFFGYTG